jgi:hypothetical protein
MRPVLGNAASSSNKFSDLEISLSLLLLLSLL